MKDDLEARERVVKRAAEEGEEEEAARELRLAKDWKGGEKNERRR